MFFLYLPTYDKLSPFTLKEALCNSLQYIQIAIITSLALGDYY